MYVCYETAVTEASSLHTITLTALSANVCPTALLKLFEPEIALLLQVPPAPAPVPVSAGHQKVLVVASPAPAVSHLGYVPVGTVPWSVWFAVCFIHGFEA